MGDERSGSNGLGALWRALVMPTMLRTCTKCGTQWRVPRFFSRQRPKGPPMLRAVSRARVDTGSGRTESGRLSAFGLCPNCQSQQHTQKRIWHLSKAEYEGLG